MDGLPLVRSSSNRRAADRRRAPPSPGLPPSRAPVAIAAQQPRDLGSGQSSRGLHRRPESSAGTPPVPFSGLGNHAPSDQCITDDRRTPSARGRYGARDQAAVREQSGELRRESSLSTAPTVGRLGQQRTPLSSWQNGGRRSGGRPNEVASGSGSQPPSRGGRVSPAAESQGSGGRAHAGAHAGAQVKVLPPLGSSPARSGMGTPGSHRGPGRTHDDCTIFNSATSRRLPDGSVVWSAGGSVEPTVLDGRHVLTAHQDIGSRKTQEDRVVVAKNIGGVAGACLFAVLDGTVGHFASDTAKDLLVPYLVASPHWAKASKSPHDEASARAALSDMFQSADAELLRRAAVSGHYFAASTCVVALVLGKSIHVAHVGDSRALLAATNGSQVAGWFVTVDHKPDMPAERARIEANGGSVEYLQRHTSNPFVRGGDFGFRKANGEQVMQLQYSRAMGALDLKTFGLTSQPTCSTLVGDAVGPSSSAIVIVLGSDGLWDQVDSRTASELAVGKLQAGANAAERLVAASLSAGQRLGVASDNISCIAVQLRLFD